jgi:hypothetical protein
MFFSPLIGRFSPADDYAIYVHFAEAVSDGHNPYSLPDKYRSTVPPTFFQVGSTQTAPGKIIHQYADYPPLLMLFNSWMFRLHNLKGLYWLYIVLYAVSCLLYCVYAFSHRGEHQHDSILFLIFLGLNPMVKYYWFIPISDKAWFLFFILSCLLLRHTRYWLTLALAVFAALKGLGLVVFIFYLAFLFFEKSTNRKSLFYMALLFAIVVAATHCLWFPDWLNAYAWRASRQNWVGHTSVFVPLARAGLYWGGMAKVLTAGAFLALAFATAKRLLTLQEILLLPIVVSIVFNTELTFDRLLVAVFALLLLSNGSLPIVVAYAAGALMFTPVLHYFLPFLGSFKGLWLVQWSLTTFLAITAIRQIVLRGKGYFAQGAAGDAVNHTP